MGAPRHAVRRAAAGLLICLGALANAGCDFSCGVQRTATFTGSDVAPVVAALRADPTIEVGAPERGTEPSFACSRLADGVTADLQLLTGAPSTRIRISHVELNHVPTAEEAAKWTALVEHLCREVGAASPSVGTWANEDRLDDPRPSVPVRLVCCLGPPFLVVAAIVAAAKVRRRRPLVER